MSSPRFKFGKNWQSYARSALTADRIEQARQDFQTLYAGIPLEGKPFLDVGFGQGLILSLAAEAGARVTGVDIDGDNVAAASETMRHFKIVIPPTVITGSILDGALVAQFKNNQGFAVVHSWGVLHHTGDMDAALRNVAELVRPDGYLVVALYNRHWTSPLWKLIKYIYNVGGPLVQRILVALLYPLLYLATWFCTGNSPRESRRGMDFRHDVIDWIGGYPYQYAAPEQIVALVTALGFSHVRTISAKVPTGNNEFIFRRQG